MSNSTLSTAEKADYAQRVFLKYTLTDVERIGHGIELRDWIHEQIRQGLYPNHYRRHWLMDSAEKVLSHLKSVAQAFNYTHADDHATIYDMLDILETAKSELRRRRDRGVRGV